MNNYLPTDTEYVHIYGRTKVQNPLPLFWTGSGIEFSTNSSEVWIELEADYEHKENWVQIEMDDIIIQRFIVPKGRHKFCVYRDFSDMDVRCVRLLMSAQPFGEDSKRKLLVHGIECSGSLKPVQKKKMNIEFVGDSLTSGEGLTGTRKTSAWSAGIFGIQDHYALTVARHFNADYRLVSQCGWGVYSAWDNNINNNIPDHYLEICSVLNGEDNKELGAFDNYDFDSWKADIVVINLGTNDWNGTNMPMWTDPDTGKSWKMTLTEAGELNELSKTTFQNAMFEFLKKVRKYNQNSIILWVYGMCGQEMDTYIAETLENYKSKTGDKKVDYQKLADTREEWRGANNHPGRKDHLAAAELIIEKINNLLLTF